MHHQLQLNAQKVSKEFKMKNGVKSSGPHIPPSDSLLIFLSKHYLSLSLSFSHESLLVYEMAPIEDVHTA